MGPPTPPYHDLADLAVEAAEVLDDVLHLCGAPPAGANTRPLFGLSCAILGDTLGGFKHFGDKNGSG